MTRHLARAWRLALLALLLAFLLRPALFEPVLRPLTENNAPAIYNKGDLLSLTLSHLKITAIATLGAALLAVAMAVFVTRRAGADFLPLSRSVVNIGQTFPPVAVLALAVPAMGFGEAPTLVALFLYGLLPIFETTIAGLTGVPRPVVEAARGVGMTGWQRLLQIELPLALPLVVAGLRLSAVIGLGTATIGSTVGARTLGEVVIAGLLSDNPAFIVQGGAIVGALAILLHDALSWLEQRLARRA
ncbi:ABC transporter [Aureimonas ureilytica]|uniref:ABC transporter n=1 Tax=Aureimonas ureilytica TaxID=401562 RepID=A0A175R392_9HYPH|nr:ABC transporter permease [Aureimonas ureilytica]KTQ84211.1 ABC transporter [Aureimonas ureilytica]